MSRYFIDNADFLDELADRAADAMHRRQYDDERDDIDAAIARPARHHYDDEPDSDR